MVSTLKSAFNGVTSSVNYVKSTYQQHEAKVAKMDEIADKRVQQAAQWLNLAPSTNSSDYKTTTDYECE